MDTDEMVDAALAGLGIGEAVTIPSLPDMADWSRFNAIYREFFSEPWPARSAFGANGLALNARVEVEAFAASRS